MRLRHPCLPAELEGQLAAAQQAQQDAAAAEAAARAEADKLRHGSAEHASHAAELEARLRAAQTDQRQLQEQVGLVG